MLTCNINMHKPACSFESVILIMLCISQGHHGNPVLVADAADDDDDDGGIF